MRFRAEVLLAIAVLASGCNVVPKNPETDPGISPPRKLLLSVPVSASLALQSKDKSLPAPPALMTRAGGIAELVHAQRQVARGTKRAGSLQISRARILAEMNNVLEAVRYGKYDDVPGALGVNTAAAPNAVDFFRRYFEAYFRKFEFINAGLNEAQARERLTRDLRNAMNLDRPLTAKEEQMIKETVDGIVSSVCKDNRCQLLKADEEAGFFYNRAGQKFGFPTITVSLNPGAARLIEVTKIDEIALIGDLTRVAIEALGDSLTRSVPSDARATGCSVPSPLFPATSCIAESDKAAYAKLRCIVKAADTTEAVVGFAAAMAVRGGSIFGLNNEALAKAIQVAFSVTARKIAEEEAVDACGTPKVTAEFVKETLEVELVD